jgi:hypothetical protein
LAVNETLFSEFSINTLNDQLPIGNATNETAATDLAEISTDITHASLQSLSIIALDGNRITFPDEITGRFVGIKLNCDQPFELVGGVVFYGANDNNDSLIVSRQVWNPFPVVMATPLIDLVGAGTVTRDLGGNTLGGPVAVDPANGGFLILFQRLSAGGEPGQDFIELHPIILAPVDIICSVEAFTS